MTFLGTVGRLMAFGVVVVAVVIALVPNLVYTELPSDLTLDLTSPTTMVVTGANSGLGLATVQHFAHNPQTTIIMACRNMEKCQDAKTQIFRNLHESVRANLLPMTLDLSHKSSIEAFAKQLQDKPIHILVNNAGLAGVTEHLKYHPDDGVENHIRVNHLGPVYLTHCLWKNLQLADRPARIVMVSSLLGSLPKSIPTLGWYKGEENLVHAANLKMYGRSKRANIMFAAELHERFGITEDNAPSFAAHNTNGITVVVAHPGLTHTDLCKNGCKGQRQWSRKVAQSNAYTGIFKMTPSNGALPQAYAAVLAQSGVYIGPKWFIVGEPVIVGGLTSSWHHAGFTKDQSQALWTKSLAAMQIKEFGEFEFSVVDEAETHPASNPQQEESVQHQQHQQHQQQRQEIPVREEPMQQDDEPVHEDPSHNYDQQSEPEPEPTQVYEQSEVNDQMHDTNSQQERHQEYQEEYHHQELQQERHPEQHQQYHEEHHQEQHQQYHHEERHQQHHNEENQQHHEEHHQEQHQQYHHEERHQQHHNEENQQYHEEHHQEQHQQYHYEERQQQHHNEENQQQQENDHHETEPEHVQQQEQEEHVQHQEQAAEPMHDNNHEQDPTAYMGDGEYREAAVF